MGPRDVQVSIRFSAQEHEFLSFMAEESGLPLAGYVRMCAVMHSKLLAQRAHDMAEADKVIRESAVGA